MEQKFINKTIIFAPHLDDEIIGCYSVLSSADYVVYFNEDDRIGNIKYLVKTSQHEFKFSYIHISEFNLKLIENSNIYVPSKFDYHPYHHTVRKFVLGKINLEVNDIFYYSIEMNTPFLKECKDPEDKNRLLRKYYPSEDLFLKDDKYWLFESINSFDTVIYKFYFIDKDNNIGINVPYPYIKENILEKIIHKYKNNIKILHIKINSLLPDKLNCK